MSSDQPKKEQQLYIDYNAAALSLVPHQSPNNSLASLTPPSSSEQTLFTPTSSFNPVLDLSEDEQDCLEGKFGTQFGSIAPLYNFTEEASRTLLWTSAPTRVVDRDDTVNDDNVFAAFNPQQLYHQSHQYYSSPNQTHNLYQHQVKHQAALRSPLSQLDNNHNLDTSWQFSTCPQGQSSSAPDLGDNWESWMTANRMQNDHLTVNPNQIYTLPHGQVLYEPAHQLASQPLQSRSLFTDTDDEVQSSPHLKPHRNQPTAHRPVVSSPVPYNNEDDENDEGLIWQRNTIPNEQSVIPQKAQVYAYDSDDDDDNPEFKLETATLDHQQQDQSSSSDLQNMGYTTNWTEARCLTKGKRKHQEGVAFENDPRGTFFETDGYVANYKGGAERFKGKEHLGNKSKTRAKNVCTECHRAKIRCSIGHPCERCVTRNLTCIFPEKPKTRGKGKSPRGSSMSSSASPYSSQESFRSSSQTPSRRGRGPYNKRQKFSQT